MKKEFKLDWGFGANFYPSTAINQLEMWQEDTFDPETIDRELGFAEKIGMTRKGVIETIVGDVQRMELYAQKGYQAPVEIPAEVRKAFDALVVEGYTGQLAK